ncbi:MAG: RluA family pseudouridine synthase [Coprobacillus sp.]
MKTLRIDENHANQRIDKYLKKLLCQAPSQLIYKMLRKKDVKVNGIKVKESYILQLNDEVELFLYEDKFQEYTQPTTIFDLKITFDVLYEDEHILVVNKPSGLLVHEDINEDMNTLSNQVLTYLYQKGEYDPQTSLGFTPGPVHRLDRNTSGIVIFGKKMRALQDLNEMIKKRHCIDKTYLTICKGYMPSSDLVGYMKKESDQSLVKVVSKTTPGALTMHTIVENIQGNQNYSLLKVKLITGRTHQIRVHLSSEGHPIIGDSKYGDFELNKYMKKKYHLDHQFLHAYQIQFVKPIGCLKYLQDNVIVSHLPKNLSKIKNDIFDEMS